MRVEVFMAVRRHLMLLILFFHQPVLAGDGYSALIGEWSPRGKCDSVRFAYTEDGKYLWLVRNQGKVWEKRYEGLYSALSRTELEQKKVGSKHAVIIADGNDQCGYLVRLDVMNRSRLKGIWVADDMLSFRNAKDARFDYVRCGER